MSKVEDRSEDPDLRIAERSWWPGCGRQSKEEVPGSSSSMLPAEKIPGHALHEKAYREKRRRSTGQQPGQTALLVSAINRLPTAYQPLINRSSTARCVPPSFYIGFRLFVLLENHKETCLRYFRECESRLSTGQTVLSAPRPARPRPAVPMCAPTRPARGMSGFWTPQVEDGGFFVVRTKKEEMEGGPAFFGRRSPSPNPSSSARSSTHLQGQISKMGRGSLIFGSEDRRLKMEGFFDLRIRISKMRDSSIFGPKERRTPSFFEEPLFFEDSSPFFEEPLTPPPRFFEEPSSLLRRPPPFFRAEDWVEDRRGPRGVLFMQSMYGNPYYY